MFARVVELMGKEQDKSELRLTDEQAAEVRRRLAEAERHLLPEFGCARLGEPPATSAACSSVSRSSLLSCSP